jgi:hypothetical protein
VKINIQRWLREPLVHFLLLGALLFLLFHFVKGSSNTAQGKIVVSAGTVRTLSENFQRVWQRPPTQMELDGLIQDYIKEEVYYREAQAMGIDRDDPVVRRRLRQKMEFLADGIATSAEPTEKDLEDYLKRNPEKFRIEPRYTFSQVYLNPDKHPDSLTKDTAELLAILKQKGESAKASDYGDSFMLGYFFSNVPETNVIRIFGEDFAKALPGLKTKEWSGPIKSGYGEHMVFINDRVEGRIPSLQEVRAQVQREWLAEHQRRALEDFYKGLRDRYQVSIEKPESSNKKGTGAAEAQQ